MLWFPILLIFGVFVYAFYRVVSRNRQISAQAELVNLFLGIFRPKYFLKRVSMSPRRSSLPLRVSESFSARYDTVYHSVNGTELMTAKSRGAESNIHLLYFHGGAYVLGKNGVRGNESFVSSLLEATGSKVTFVDYPVAPESKFIQTLEAVYEAYAYLVETCADEVFIFVGDSAGGGLALSLAQFVTRRHEIRGPEKVVLFSPWLDLSLENPEIDGLVKKDMILSKEALLYAAQQYAEPEEFKNPLVSPIYGNFKGLGPTIMFFASYELFYADGLKMQKIAEASKLDISFRFYNEMPHDWVIFPIPEARRALQEASEFISGT